MRAAPPHREPRRCAASPPPALDPALRAEWQALRPFRRHERRPGRPLGTDPRPRLDARLRAATTGPPWRARPEHYGRSTTIARHFRRLGRRRQQARPVKEVRPAVTPDIPGDAARAAPMMQPDSTGAGGTMLGRRGLIGGMAAAGLAAGTARAQARFPERPLRWVVGYPPGGASDLFARLIAAQMAVSLGQPVVVENRPGGGAVVASETVARAAPDGHTLLTVDNGILVYNPALYARLPYDPDRDFQGVGFIGRFPLFIVVRPDNPARDFADLVARSKVQAPNYGSPAVASPHHLAMEMVKRRTGLVATHVPYRGGPAAMHDLLGGALEVVCIDTSTGLPFIRDGKVRALCVLGERRSPRAPEVPTLRELGHPEAVAYGWQGVSVPAGTPAPVLARLHEALLAGVAAEEVQARFRDLGIEDAPLDPEAFQEFVRRESALWRPLIRELGIRLDS
ncbi:tripartite tricarboxylate transporter substrate-binding protein [Crenalkalicoccus roseus]|uniref:tripartite tricarboxylate transporter substrate-binding protein n=1 Tax=Crenalkalicoccus roseus TaxID=1485588 RepID=UPI001EFF6A48|nr:tripartite tricarboxylate transporter substrate-binding protein [Crenalkalicoccus roseus]